MPLLALKMCYVSSLTTFVNSDQSVPLPGPYNLSCLHCASPPAGAPGAAESRQAESRGVAEESEEQRNHRWAMAKESGEASGDNGTSATTHNRSDVSNTNGTANATAPQDGISVGAGEAGTLGLATST